MQYDLIPPALHRDINQLLQELTQFAERVPSHCSYCGNHALTQTRTKPLTLRCKACLKYFNPLTHTPFNRLQPIAWLPMILAERIKRQSYQVIAERLECDIKQIMRRDKALKQRMQLAFPDLYPWYCAHNDVAKQFTANPINDALSAQHRAFKQQLSEILSTTHSPCRYCHSSHTVNVGQRATFRCNHCRRGFSLLHDTPILRLPHADQWLTYLDLLVAKQSNREIAEQLGMNRSTLGAWRHKWCHTMQLWGFASLALWCKRQ